MRGILIKDLNSTNRTLILNHHDQWEALGSGEEVLFGI